MGTTSEKMSFLAKNEREQGTLSREEGLGRGWESWESPVHLGAPMSTAGRSGQQKGRAGAWLAMYTDATPLPKPEHHSQILPSPRHPHNESVTESSGFCFPSSTYLAPPV